MPSQTTQPVVLLYVHALLGHGLANHLRLTTGIEVIAVPVCDVRGVEAALALHPRVVVFERSTELTEESLRDLVGDATLVDVSDAVSPAGAVVPEQGGAPQAEMIVQIVDHAYAVAG